MNKLFLLLLVSFTVYSCAPKEKTDNQIKDGKNDKHIIDTIINGDIEGQIDLIDTTKLFGKWQGTLDWFNQDSCVWRLRTTEYPKEFIFNKGATYQYIKYDMNGKVIYNEKGNYWAEQDFMFFIDSAQSAEAARHKKLKEKYSIHLGGMNVHLVNDSTLRLLGKLSKDTTVKGIQILEYKRVK